MSDEQWNQYANPGSGGTGSGGRPDPGGRPNPGHPSPNPNDDEYELTDEDKSAIDRLAMGITQERVHTGATSSGEDVNVQLTRMAEVLPAVPLVTEGESAVPDFASAFLDARDPMVAPDGHTPDRIELRRLRVGFALAAIIGAIPWSALTSLILPELLDLADPVMRDVLLATAIAVGAVVAWAGTAVFGEISDVTRTPLGRRVPWVVGGGLLTAVIMLLAWALGTGVGTGVGAGVGVGTGVGTGVGVGSGSLVMLVVLWCLAQGAYQMMLAPLLATIADRIPDKASVRVTAWYGRGVAVGQTLGVVLGFALIVLGVPDVIWPVSAAAFAIIAIAIPLVWPREPSSQPLPPRHVKLADAFRRYLPPKDAPGFVAVLWGRSLMMGGYNMVAIYLFFIAKHELAQTGWPGSPFGVPAAGGRQASAVSAAFVVLVAGAITLLSSLVASFVDEPIIAKIDSHKASTAFAGGLIALAVAMPWIIHGPVGVWLFALIGGFGYGIYNDIGQEMSIAVLPDPATAGRDLGALNMANTLCLVIGAVFGAVVVVLSGGEYEAISPLAVFVVVLATGLLARVPHVD